jgi:hypothetical protein
MMVDVKRVVIRSSLRGKIRLNLLRIRRGPAAVAASYISFQTPDITSKLEDSIFTHIYGTNSLMINNPWYLSNPTVPSFSSQDSNILKPIFGVTGL